MSKYVCAFRGRRDSYQVPLALAETSRLDQLITDFWAGPFVRALPVPARWREKLAARHESGICDERVRCLWASTLREHFRHWRGGSRAETYAQLDPLYGRAAADRARRTRADLLMYSPYAWEAFTASYSHHPRRLLFQFHPHAAYEREVLQGDFRRYPEIACSYAQETGEELSPSQRRRIDDCWQHADGILCASTFTRHTMVKAGAAPERCSVVPYGIELPPPTQEQPPDRPFRALFVGSGIQRKGLHHLLRAWHQARLPVGSQLTLVCRYLDPGLENLVASNPATDLRRGVSQGELARLYTESSLFVLPSLVEGFGQVFLEALAHGCPVLGTVNTCLPDLGTGPDGVFVTPPGDVEALSSSMETLAQDLPGNLSIRQRARELAATFTWKRFRATIAGLT